MRRLMFIFCFVLISILITGCTKQPSLEEIKAYEIRKEKANGFRVHGTIDERLQVSLLSTFRSTADPDKIKECSSYNAWRVESARRRFLDYEINTLYADNPNVKIGVAGLYDTVATVRLANEYNNGLNLDLIGYVYVSSKSYLERVC